MKTQWNCKDFIAEFNKTIDDEDVPHGEDDNDLALDDNYISVHVGLPHGPDDQLIPAIVKRREVYIDTVPIDIANPNPVLDTHQYEVEYNDDLIKTLAANINDKNILLQLDQEGHKQKLLYDIIDHQPNHKTVSEADAFITTSSGGKNRKKTTKGWEICVEWNSGKTTWAALKDLKQSYHIELLLYAKSQIINNTPTFAKWVPLCAKSKNRSLANSNLNIGNIYINLAYTYQKPSKKPLPSIRKMGIDHDRIS